MKQLILNALKAKFQGVSDAILDRVANKLAQTVTTAEQVQTAVDGVTFQQVLESYGDSRATQAQQTAVHTYEQKYGLKDGVKVTPEPPTSPVPPVVSPVTTPTDGGVNNSVTQLLNQLLEENKKLNGRLDKMDTERTTATRRQQISALTDKLPENIKKAYNRTPVENLTDEEFNTLLGEITIEVSDITSQVQQRGVVFGKPTVNNGGSQNELTKEQLEAISHRDGTVGADNQPF